MLSRRHFLALGGAVGTAALITGREMTRADAGQPGALSQPGHQHGAPTGAAVATAVTPFSVRMPTLPVLSPVASRFGTDLYRLPVRAANVEILPGLSTPALTYGGRFVGPTIRARAGRRVLVSVGNEHDMPTNVHLHGGHVAASNDGHPLDVIEPGRSRLYEYPNGQQGATLWYHDHSHHMEAEHVYRGLAGFYLIEDDSERELRLPGGPYDVPIALRDALFDANGALVFGGNPAFRDVILANGRPSPYFPVARRKYRFRLLNSATERIFTLSLGGQEMTQIASDGGLLPAPVARTQLRLGSAERTEIVVDFSRHPIGTQLVLEDTRGPVLRFDVVREASDSSRVPDALRPLPALPAATVERDVVLSSAFGPTGIPVGMVNGKPYDPARNDVQVTRGDTEIWRIRNADVDFGGFMHTFHLHLVQFRVLNRDGTPPGPDDRGLKDTIVMPPGTTARVQATFRDFLGKYVYHCHFLEHSSIGMMAQMEIVP
jgi:spore coat protein A